jgi:hypothetical protein
MSASDAVESAFRWMVRVLFRPFSLSKWLVLGFCSFLASLAPGGCNARVNFNAWGNGDVHPGAIAGHASSWLAANVALALLAGGAILLVVIAVGVLLLWLSSRGQFMFLDGVVHDRARVSEPWKRLKRPANSLFKLRLVLALTAFLLVMFLAVACFALAWTDIRMERFGPGALAALLLGLVLILPTTLAFALVRVLLRDFVVPVMYVKDLLVVQACGEVWHRLIRPNLGLFALFYLLRVGLALAAGFVVLLGTCLTCCIAALPYISSVVFLPVAVFFRAYPLFFLAGLGPEWDPGMKFPEEASGPPQLPEAAQSPD